jgi:tRNA/rRNA methyltransferase
LPFDKSKKIKTASKKDIQIMVSHCIKNLNQINFFKPKEKKPIMLENLKNIFYKMDLSTKEIRILSSIFAQISKTRN